MVQSMGLQRVGLSNNKAQDTEECYIPLADALRASVGPFQSEVEEFCLSL